MEMKRGGRTGPGRSSTGKVLKRVVNWSGDGFTWEADPKLTEKLLNMLDLGEGKGALTPGGKDIGKDDRNVDCELEYSDTKLVQAAAGLEQYIALDRPDIAYSVKTALQQMLKPTKPQHVAGRWQMVFRCWKMGCAFVRSTHGLKTRKRRPGVGRPLEGTSTGSALHHVWVSRGWSLMTQERTGPVFLCRCASVRFAPHRGGV